MGSQGLPRAAFSDVDGSGLGHHLISYLDDARGSPAVIAAKGWALEALQLSPGMWALDVGCGTGEDVLAMADRIQSDGGAVGIDVSATMIREAEQRHGRRRDVEFTTADTARLPFDGGTFDACRCERTLQHLEDPEAALDEMTRVLRPAGRLALIEPDWDTLIVAGPDPGTSRRILTGHVTRHRQPAIGRRLRGLLTARGFTDIELSAGVHFNTDLSSASRAFGLTGAANRAVAAGAVSDKEAVDWVRDLETADQKQALFAAVTVFRVSGRLEGECSE